jgi:hypothetical protein
VGIVLASNFNVNTALPLDARTVVVDNTARDALASGVRYDGLAVYVTSTLKTWQLQGGVANSNWVDTSQTSSFAGDLSIGGYLKKSNAVAITAFAGGGQASATAITKDTNRVTVCATAGDSVKLPVSIAGMMVFVQNDGAASLNIFPASGELINALAANTAIAVLPGGNHVFTCVAAGVWKTAEYFKANLNGGNTFSGVQTFAGDIIAQAYLKRSSAATITAFAGGGQASATQIAVDVNRITTCATAADSVKLPSAVVGMQIFIQNDGAAAANVFPATGQVINGLAANVALSVPFASNSLFVCVATGVWKSIAGSGGSSAGTRAGFNTLANLTGDVYVTFSTALLDTNYAIAVSFTNTVDADPIFLMAVITAKSTTGFTAHLNALTDSTNYVMNWQVIANA